MAWDGNFFKFCSGLRVLGYFMILLVGAIVVVSCGSLLRHGGLRCALSVVIIAVFHLLLILLLWSYFLVVSKIQAPFHKIGSQWQMKIQRLQVQQLLQSLQT